MFLILNMAGALTSYQSFLEKGSTLHLNKARKKKKKNHYFSTDCTGLKQLHPQTLREIQMRTPHTSQPRPPRTRRSPHLPAPTSYRAAPRAPPQLEPRAGPGPAAAMTAAILSYLRPAATIRHHPPHIRGILRPPRASRRPRFPPRPALLHSHFLLGAFLAAFSQPLVLADRHTATAPRKRESRLLARDYTRAVLPRELRPQRSRENGAPPEARLSSGMEAQGAVCSFRPPLCELRPSAPARPSRPRPAAGGRVSVNWDEKGTEKVYKQSSL